MKFCWFLLLGTENNAFAWHIPTYNLSEVVVTCCSKNITSAQQEHLELWLKFMVVLCHSLWSTRFCRSQIGELNGDMMSTYVASFKSFIAVLISVVTLGSNILFDLLSGLLMVVVGQFQRLPLGFSYCRLCTTQGTNIKIWHFYIANCNSLIYF